jgi:hypothetical protein
MFVLSGSCEIIVPYVLDVEAPGRGILRRSSRGSAEAGQIPLPRAWCTTLKRGKRSVAVHHRELGNSDPSKMLTLCLPCHAKVTRTFYVKITGRSFLRVLWRERHPDGHEQRALNLGLESVPARNVHLFRDVTVR